MSDNYSDLGWRLIGLAQDAAEMDPVDASRSLYTLLYRVAQADQAGTVDAAAVADIAEKAMSRYREETTRREAHFGSRSKRTAEHHLATQHAGPVTLAAGDGTALS